MDLNGSLERPAADADLKEDEANPLVPIQISGPAEVWTRKVIDAFPSVDNTLAQRLGEANWQRYQRVVKGLEKAELFEDEDEGENDGNGEDNESAELGALPTVTDTTKSSADPGSIFSSAGQNFTATGTSISGAHFEYAFPRVRRQHVIKDYKSQVTYTSMASNFQSERGWLKIPSMPKGADEGKVFRCTVCGERQKDIISCIEWKRHVFTDLQPYICTFANCKAGLTSYATRKAWADHEFFIHRKDKIWVCDNCSAQFSEKDDMRDHAANSHGYVHMRNHLEEFVNTTEKSTGIAESVECPFCHEVPGIERRAFVMHVGRHMEEIAMAVLPRDADFQEDGGSLSSNILASSDVSEGDESLPETRKVGLMKGLPPAWELKRTDSGRAYCTDQAGRTRLGEIPNLSQDEWELEFCHALVVELLKPRFADTVSLFVKKNISKFHIALSAENNAPCNLMQIEGNLRHYVYSNTGEFRRDVAKLEDFVLRTNHNDESANMACRKFRRIFENHLSQMSRWLRVNKANQSNQVSADYTSIDQFDIIALIGRRSVAKIFLAESKSDQHLYNIKIVRKELVIETEEAKTIKNEKKILIKARDRHHPFVARLVSTFQTDTRLYIVTEHLSGGDLMYHIQREVFGITRSRFYAAEICLALNFLHDSGLIHRDLTLENIMLTSEGHIKIVDFGISAWGINDHYGLTQTFCGSAEFMAPEIISDKPYGRAVDWWSFGVLVYQMLLQQSPFRGEDADEVFDSILSDEPSYPIDMPPDSQNLIERLLKKEPEARLGYDLGASEVMTHDFFTEIDWDALYRKDIAPPFKPKIDGRNDLSNFEVEFTGKMPILSPATSVLTPFMQEQFKDF